MKILLPLLLLLCGSAANAQNRAVMEGIRTQAGLLLVSTRTGSVQIQGQLSVSSAVIFASSVSIREVGVPITFTSSATFNAPVSLRHVNTATTFASSITVNSQAGIPSIPVATTIGGSVTVNNALDVNHTTADSYANISGGSGDASAELGIGGDGGNHNVMFYSQATNNSGFLFRTRNTASAANVNALSISGDGAATFSSSVTVRGNAFQVDGSTFAVSAGNVGIGVAAPTSRLTVRSESGNVFVQNVLSSDNQSLFTVEQVASAGAGRIDIYDAAGSAGAVIRGSGDSYILNGDFGMGTFSPASDLGASPTLHIAGAAPSLRLDDTGTSTDAEFYIDGSTMNFATRHVGGLMRFSTGDGVDALTIPANGVVTGGALCLNASKILSKCTSQPDASGNCTCP